MTRSPYTVKHLLSRRHFCLCCIGSATLAASGVWLSPGRAYAEARNLVDLQLNPRTSAGRRHERR
jgi:hypothetical protein